MLTICILILVAMYFSRPLGSLVDQLKDVNWQDKFSSLKEWLVKYGKKAGRAAARPLLQFYFVVTDSETTTAEKAMIYGCIAYVVLPFSFIPRAVYRFLGIMDEAAAVLFVYSKIKDKITPQIEIQVEQILDSWFGAEYAVIE